jgi:hypothetical protein
MPGPYVVALQRRLGLYISSARASNDAILEAGGEPDSGPDYLGDLACNAGEHSTRHHAANRAWRSALAAVAIGEVILGDKEKAGEYKKYNNGHVPDIVQPGASAWGTDWIGRDQGALAARRRSGQRSVRACRAPSRLWQHRGVAAPRDPWLPRPRPAAARGRAPPAASPPFDHKTGEGHVRSPSTIR